MKVVSVIPGTTYATGVSTSDLADYLKVTYANDPTIITLSLNAAVQYVEGLLWMHFVNKTVTLIGDDWEDGEYEIDIFGTYGSATITYFDSDNASQTLTPDSVWIERVDDQNSILHVEKSTYPTLYDRKDAIKIVLAITASDSSIPARAVEMIYQIAGYFYDCRVNDKEPQMTVVEKLAMAMRLKEY